MVGAVWGDDDDDDGRVVVGLIPSPLLLLLVVVVEVAMVLLPVVGRIQCCPVQLCCVSARPESAGTTIDLDKPKSTMQKSACVELPIFTTFDGLTCAPVVYVCMYDVVVYLFCGYVVAYYEKRFGRPKRDANNGPEHKKWRV